MKPAILIAGFPYVRQNYFETFKHYPPGQELWFLLPETWKAKGGKVVFHAPKEPNVIPTKAFFYHSRYPVISGLLKGWMPAFPLHVKHLKREKKIKLVYSCSEPHLLTTLYNGIWTKIFGLKHVIFTWENIPYWEKFSWPNWQIKKLIIKANLALADGIICGNIKGAEIYKKLTKKAIAVIPMNGVDENFFKRRLGPKVFEGQDWTNKVVYTFVGAIGYRKGIHLIIKAFKGVRTFVPTAHLVIAGSGEYEKQVDVLIRELGLELYVTRIPWVTHQTLVPLLNASDVFLYPSISYGGWEEQFGYSMAEASLMELPVIATHSGSIADVVKDDKTGILVEPDNVDSLSLGMIKLGSDPDLRKKMGLAGREYIAKNYSHQVVARKFADFFDTII